MKKITLFLMTLALLMAVFSMLTPVLASAETNVIYKGEDYAITRTSTIWNPETFSDGLALVWGNGIGKSGYIDKSGKIAIPLIYDYAFGFSEGLAIVKIEDKWGVIDKNGRIVITPQYDNIQNFSEGIAIVRNNGKKGGIDKVGNIIIPIEYDDVKDPGAGVICVILNEKYGYLDKLTGKVIIPCEYDFLEFVHDFRSEAFRGGFARAKKEGKWGFFDKSGNVAIPFDYDYANDFYEGLARVVKDNVVYYINTLGEKVIKLEGYDGGGDFHEGLARVYKIIKPSEPPYVAPTNLFGFIDTSGNLVLPLQYGNAGDFHDGISWVGLDGDTCYINKKGEIIARFKNANPPNDFNNGLLHATEKGKSGIINSKGGIVVPFEVYNFISVFSEGFAIVQKGGGTSDWGNGYIDANGNVIIPLEYNNTEAFHDNLACVSQKDDKSKGRSKYFILEKINAVSPTESRVFVDKREIAFDAYNINDNNYFKLRDLAYVLNGSSKQFSVNWNESENSISLRSGKTYVPVGGELEINSDTAKIPFATDSNITLNGEKLSVTIYNIDGNNYFKLRDIGATLDFSVEWNADNNSVIIDSTKGYSAN